MKPKALSQHLFGSLRDSIIDREERMENAIRNAIIKFEQEFLGRGPDEVRALVARDLVVVRLKGRNESLRVSQPFAHLFRQM